MASMTSILKALIDKGNREGVIAYRTLPRGLNLIYTPPIDDGPASLRLSRPPKLVSGQFFLPRKYRVVYPSGDEVKIVKGALKPLISRPSFGNLKINDPYEVEKRGRLYGSILMNWYPVEQEGLL